MISKAPGVQFKDVHPTPTVGKPLHTEGDDVKYIRCKQCGFIVNKERNPKGSGYGNEITESITTIAGGTANAKNPIIMAGCPMCGSSEYE